MKNKQTKKVKKLKNWVKVMLIIIADIIVYNFVSTNGSLAMKSQAYALIIGLGWIWLVFGQFLVGNAILDLKN